MYAIIKDGGKNYKVFPGQVVELEKIKSDSKEVTFSEVLYVNSKDGISVGAPTLEGVKVTGIIEEEEVKGDKVTVFKFKRRKKYRRRQGHRQKYTKVRIQKIVTE